MNAPFNFPLMASPQHADDIEDAKGNLVIELYGHLDDPQTRIQRDYIVEVLNAKNQTLPTIEESLAALDATAKKMSADIQEITANFSEALRNLTRLAGAAEPEGRK